MVALRATCSIQSASGWRVMPPKDVAHRSIRDGMTQVGQGAYDAVISPAPVLARHLHYQPLYFGQYPGSARIAAAARAVELVCHQLPIPSEKGIRLGHAGDVLEGFTAESFGDLRQGGSLGIRQAESDGQVCSENAILGG